MLYFFMIENGLSLMFASVNEKDVFFVEKHIKDNPLVSVLLQIKPLLLVSSIQPHKMEVPAFCCRVNF